MKDDGSDVDEEEGGRDDDGGYNDRSVSIQSLH